MVLNNSQRFQRFVAVAAFPRNLTATKSIGSAVAAWPRRIPECRGRMQLDARARAAVRAARSPARRPRPMPGCWPPAAAARRRTPRSARPMARSPRPPPPATPIAAEREFHDLFIGARARRIAALCLLLPDRLPARAAAGRAARRPRCGSASSAPRAWRSRRTTSRSECEIYAGLLSGSFDGGAEEAEAFFAQHLRPWAGAGLRGSREGGGGALLSRRRPARARCGRDRAGGPRAAGMMRVGESHEMSHRRTTTLRNAAASSRRWAWAAPPRPRRASPRPPARSAPTPCPPAPRARRTRPIASRPATSPMRRTCRPSTAPTATAAEHQRETNPMLIKRSEARAGEAAPGRGLCRACRSGGLDRRAFLKQAGVTGVGLVGARRHSADHDRARPQARAR